MNCIERLTLRATFLYDNGFGFPLQPNKKFSICSVKITDQSLALIATETNAHLTISSDWDDNQFLQVPWTEHEKIFAVLTALIKHRYVFKTCTEPALIIDAGMLTPTLKEASVTSEWLERLRLSELHSGLNDQTVHDSERYPDKMFDPWNWQTPEGQEFCAQLRILKQMPPGTLEHKNNFYNNLVFKNYNPLTLQDT